MDLLCPYCYSKENKILYKQEKYKIKRCGYCRLGYLDPVPNQVFLKKFYSKEYFKKEKGDYGYRDYVSMEISLKVEAERKLAFIKNYYSKGTLLDIGSGLGIFAKEAKSSRYEVKIVDISFWAVGYVKKQYGIEGFVSDFSEKSLPQEKFDILTGWDVIEHISDPHKTFKGLKRLVKKGGFVFLTTPNLDSLDAKMLGRRWYGYKKIPEHLLYFSPTFLKKIAKEYGFEVLEIRNWGFVRSSNFIGEKIYFYSDFLGGFFKKIVQLLKISEKNFYFPFIDMIVILRKI